MNQSHNEDISNHIYNLEQLSNETDKYLQNYNILKQQSNYQQQKLIQKYIQEFDPKQQQNQNQNQNKNDIGDKIYQVLRKQYKDTIQEQIQKKLLEKLSINHESYNELDEIIFDLSMLNLGNYQSMTNNSQQIENLYIESSIYDQDSISFIQKQIPKPNNIFFKQNIPNDQNDNQQHINVEKQCQKEDIQENKLEQGQLQQQYQQQQQQILQQQQQEQVCQEQAVHGLSEIKEFEEEDIHTARVTRQLENAIDKEEYKPNINEILDENELKQLNNNLDGNKQKGNLEKYDKISEKTADFGKKKTSSESLILEKNTNEQYLNKEKQTEKYQDEDEEVHIGEEVIIGSTIESNGTNEQNIAKNDIKSINQKQNSDQNNNINNNKNIPFIERFAQNWNDISLQDDSSEEKKRQSKSILLFPKKDGTSEKSPSQLLTPGFDNPNDISNNINNNDMNVNKNIFQQQNNDSNQRFLQGLKFEKETKQQPFLQQNNLKQTFDLNDLYSDSDEIEMNDWVDQERQLDLYSQSHQQPFVGKINQQPIMSANNSITFNNSNNSNNNHIFQQNSNYSKNIQSNNFNINNYSKPQKNWTVYDDVLMEGFDDWRDVDSIEDCDYKMSDLGSNDSDFSYDKSFRDITVVDKKAYIEFVEQKRNLTQEIQNSSPLDEFQKENTEHYNSYNQNNSLNLFSQENSISFQNNQNINNNNFKSNVNFNSFKENLSQNFVSQPLQRPKSRIFGGMIGDENRAYVKMDFKKLQKAIDPHKHHGFTTPPDTEEKLKNNEKPLKKQVKKMFIKGKMVPNFAEDLKELEKVCIQQQKTMNPYEIFGRNFQKNLKLQPIFQLDNSDVDKCRGSSADWRKYSTMKSIQKREGEQYSRSQTPLKGLLGSISKQFSNMKNMFIKQ